MTVPVPPATPGVRFPRWLTPVTLAALLLGALLGIAGASADWAVPATLADVLGPVGDLWLEALRIVVVPLVVVQVGTAVLTAPTGGRLGRLTARTFGLFAVMLVGAGVLAAVATPVFAGLYDPPASVVAAVPEAAISAAAEAPAFVVGGWRIPLPTLKGVLTGRELLPLLLLAVLAAGAARLAGAGPEGRVVTRIRAASRLLLRAVRLILLAAPVAVFVIVLEMALDTGLGAAGMAVAFVLLLCLWLLVALALLYAVTVLWSGCPLPDFARAMGPATLVAVSTRSSLAALPALVESAERELDLPSEGTGMVLPLAAAVYKIGRPLVTTFELVFLAHVFGVSIGPGQMAAFLAGILLINFANPGIPGGPGGIRAYPFFMAAGVPADGYFFIQALGTLPDVLETTVNATSYMSAAVVLTWRRATGAGTPTPDAPEGGDAARPSPSPASAGSARDGAGRSP